MADSHRPAEARLEELLDRYLYLDRRFQARGGMGSLINTWERLERDLEHVAEGELEGMTREIAELVTALGETDGASGHRVVKALIEMDHELRRLRMLKRLFAASREADEPALGCLPLVLR